MMPDDWSITKLLASDPVNVYVIWPFGPRSGSRAVTPRTNAPESEWDKTTIL